MKIKYVIFFLLFFCFLSCTSMDDFTTKNYPKREEKIKKIDQELSIRYYKLLEEPINERKREALEMEYTKFYKQLNQIDAHNNKEHFNFLQQYRKKTKTQINYLQDLKGES